jgi:hypothetical protein
MVYGSDQPRADFLRTMSGGLLQTAPGNLLPFNTGGFPNETLHRVPDEALRLAGDVRANEQPALTAMHTVFVREHNRLAAGIAEANPGWSDEQIYQRARKLVGATVQSITYNEWLPALLGPGAPDVSSFAHDATVNPAIANEFATALFRLGHTLVSPRLRRVTDDGTEAIGGAVSLRDAFFDPETSASSEEIEFFLMGLASQPHQDVDPMINEELRSFLFGEPGSGGMDLAALNIQRGREHGIPDYNTLRESLGLERVSAFEEITSDPGLAASLTELYSSVDDVDPWIGALSEDHVPGAGVGELITTGFQWQFGRLAEGDAFFYRWDDSLTAEDIALIEKTSLADVILRNTSLTNLQDNVFFVVPEPSPALLTAFFSALLWVSLRSRGRHS